MAYFSGRNYLQPVWESLLSGIAEFCYKKNFKLDKKGVRILTEALSSMEIDGNHSFLYLDSCELERKILEISYNYLPAVVIPFISHADTNEMRNYIVEDAQKIAFRYEHENWDYLDGNRSIYHYVYHYIQLCNLLHHERTYKNLYDGKRKGFDGR